VGSTEQTKTGNLIIEGVLRLGQFTTANAPSGTEGALYFDTTENTTKLYSNSAWNDLGGGWDGILPNYTTEQRTAIASPEYGMMIYNTDSARVEYYLPDAWSAIQAPFAQAHSCTATIDCASEICVDGYCCGTLCAGNCDRCNVVGSLGTCTNVDSDCTGNCDVCSAGNCAASASLCTGNCDTCSGSGTVFDCSANVALCTGNCDQCTGSGTAYSCVADAGLCTTICQRTCSGSDTNYNCTSSDSNWGADTYGCTGSENRCINGICRPCGGYLYSDHCDGCAMQGDKACWYTIAALSPTCDAVCDEHGADCVTGVPAYANDNVETCAICLHFYPQATVCQPYAAGGPPHLYTRYSGGLNYCRIPDFDLYPDTYNICTTPHDSRYSYAICICDY